MSFSHGWETPIEDAWLLKAAVVEDRLQVVTDVVRSGSHAARVEVRPGDVVLNGERCEVKQMLDIHGNPIYENWNSGMQWIAFSVRLEPEWKSGNGIILQLYGPTDESNPPAVCMEVAHEFYLNLCSGDLDTPENRIWQRQYGFSNGRLSAGHWVDFVLKIKFAGDFTGEVEVWRRDEGETHFTRVLNLSGVPTLQYRSSIDGNWPREHFWNHGYYRTPATFTNVLWLDGLTRGTDFDAVVTGAWGA